MTSCNFRGRLAAAGVLGVLLLAAGSGLKSSFVNSAEAKTIVIQKTTIYITTLPKGCVKNTYGGVVVWKCGSLYYQSPTMGDTCASTSVERHMAGSQP